MHTSTNASAAATANSFSCPAAAKAGIPECFSVDVAIDYANSRLVHATLRRLGDSAETINDFKLDSLVIVGSDESIAMHVGSGNVVRMAAVSDDSAKVTTLPANFSVDVTIDRDNSLVIHAALRTCGEGREDIKGFRFYSLVLVGKDTTVHIGAPSAVYKEPSTPFAEYILDCMTGAQGGWLDRSADQLLDVMDERALLHFSRDGRYTFYGSSAEALERAWMERRALQTGSWAGNY